MSKLEEMRKTSGGSIAESMGAGRKASIIPGEFRTGPSAIPLKLQGVKRRSDVSDIPVARIGPDPDQPRKHFDEDALDRLAESLKARGQLQPIRVRWNEGREEYVVIVGERRYQAALRAALPTLACVVVEGEILPADLLSIQLIENALREDLNPIEQAKAFKSLMDANGWNQSKLGEELRITQGAVAKALATLELPARVQDMVDRGDLDRSKAYEVSRLEDPATQVEVAERVVTDGLSRDQTVEAVLLAARRTTMPEKGRGGKPKAKRLTSRIFRTQLGVRITAERAKGLDASILAAALREAAAKVEAELGTSDQAA